MNFTTDGKLDVQKGLEHMDALAAMYRQNGLSVEAAIDSVFAEGVGIVGAMVAKRWHIQMSYQLQ